MFTQNDIQQMEKRGSNQNDVEQQIQHFIDGFPYAQLVAPATPGNGLIVYNDDEIEKLETFFDEQRQSIDILKFVPASGAASRMFKHLFEFMTNYQGSHDDLVELHKDKGFNSVHYFFEHIHDFPFFDDLKKVMARNNLNIEDLLRSKNLVPILEYLLTDKGLSYASLPKGLLKFHAYKKQPPRMSIEEHLVEGAVYAASADGVAHIHFTVSPEHRKKFLEAIKATRHIYEKKYNIRFEIAFSEQKPYTDTIAVDLDNKPFRDTNGELLFRPGGHGALIENLNEIKTPLVFIKNIDNIVPDSLKPETFRYKKVIGGALLTHIQKIHAYLNKLINEQLSNETLNEIADYCNNTLFMKLDDSFDAASPEEKTKALIDKLNRPVRVCGMVKNEGEPGGGPYLVKNQKGHISLQIVESSQMDQNNPEQMEMVKNATHFNPVDLVCYLYDYQGNKFDLTEFIDPITGFISQKSKDGRDLKAQELPGLWNGAMARWITLFVEAPIITFNPVKTVNDLLRKEHQAG